MTDRVQLNIDRDVSFSTPAGKPVPAHAVAFIFTMDQGSPPNIRLLFHLSHAGYERALAEELFGLTEDAVGEPMEPFAADKQLEIEAELPAKLTQDLLSKGGGAPEMVGAMLGQDNEFSVFGSATSWQALSVMQETDGVKSGYSTTPGPSE